MEEAESKLGSTTTMLKIGLGDFIGFLNWMHHSHNAFEHGDPLPETPALESDKLRSWVQFIQKLEERYRQGEEKQMSFEANLQAQEGELGQLVSQLYGNIASLYENLGQEVKAQEIRKKASVIQSA